MRISRRKKPKKPLLPKFNKNQYITAERVLVLDENGENLGAMSTADALKLARERELDLVEINPKNDPPVAKLVVFTEFKYQKEKQARKQKAHSRSSEMKGVRLSMRISEHDLEVKTAQALKFLKRGDKVKIELIMRGRENAKRDIGEDTINRFVERVNQEVEVRQEQAITRQGKKMTAIIAKR